MMVCCSNETHRTSDESIPVTNKGEWADINTKSTDTNTHTIEDTCGILYDTSFQYSKKGTHGNSASAAPISHQQHPMPTQITVWQHIIQANNLYELTMANAVFITIKLEKAVNWALSDSGATGHFLVNGSTAVNIRSATHPIRIILPNGKVIMSTHIYNLDIPWLLDVIT